MIKYHITPTATISLQERNFIYVFTYDNVGCNEAVAKLLHYRFFYDIKFNQFESLLQNFDEHTVFVVWGRHDE